MAPENKDSKDSKNKAPTVDELVRQYADLSTRVAGVRRGL
jgi:hypothetical protein